MILLPYASSPSSQRLTRLIWTISACVLLSFHVSLISADECPSYGCPILPLDVMSDEAKSSLETLRSVKVDEKTGEKTTPTEDEQKKAAQDLSSSGNESMTTLTLCGDKGGPPINQDRAMIYSPYKIQGLSDDIETQLLGVFDGHGSKGEITSQHVVDQIPKLLAEKLSSIVTGAKDIDDDKYDVAVSNSIKETFVEVDKTDPSKTKGGATATIVLRLGSKLYIANAGDSRSFIAVLLDDDVEVVYETREDKPDLPDERARIMEMGGHVHIDPTGEDVPRAYEVMDDGQLGQGLAMSRSIGDWNCKGVIPEPIVDIIKIEDIAKKKLDSYIKSCKEEKESSSSEPEKEEIDNVSCDDYTIEDADVFAVSASDGLCDYVDLNYMAHVFAASFFVPDNPHPHTASEYLIFQAARNWHKEYNGKYRDDIAVAAVKIWSGSSKEGAKATTKTSKEGKEKVGTSEEEL